MSACISRTDGCSTGYGSSDGTASMSTATASSSSPIRARYSTVAVKLPPWRTPISRYRRTRAATRSGTERTDPAAAKAEAPARSTDADEPGTARDARHEPTLSKHHRKLPRIAQRLHRSLTQRTSTTRSITRRRSARSFIFCAIDMATDSGSTALATERSITLSERPLGEAAIVEPGPPTNAHGRPQRLLGTRRAKIATSQSRWPRRLPIAAPTTTTQRGWRTPRALPRVRWRLAARPPGALERKLARAAPGGRDVEPSAQTPVQRRRAPARRPSIESARGEDQPQPVLLPQLEHV